MAIMAEFEIERPKRTEKPWGYELLFAHTEKYAGKVLFVKKGGRLSLQYHREKDESIYVYDGEIRLHLSGAGRQPYAGTLQSGDGFRVAPHTRHRVEAVRDSYLFEVSTPELDDVVRVEDDYGRD